MLIVDVVAVIRVAGELNAYFCTVNPAQLAGQRDILACDQDFERLGHVSERHRGQPRARQTHVFQFTEHTTSIVAYQQADGTANFVARVAISSVVHVNVIYVDHGLKELKLAHSANEWFRDGQTLIAFQPVASGLAQNQLILDFQGYGQLFSPFTGHQSTFENCSVISQHQFPRYGTCRYTCLPWVVIM